MNGTTGIESPSAAAAPVRSSESLFLMTFAGLMGSALSGRPIVFFGQALPLWFARNDAVSQAFRLTHLVTSWYWSSPSRCTLLRHSSNGAAVCPS
jgi:hypothetical protein